MPRDMQPLAKAPGGENGENHVLIHLKPTTIQSNGGLG